MSKRQSWDLKLKESGFRIPHYATVIFFLKLNKSSKETVLFFVSICRFSFKAVAKVAAFARAQKGKAALERVF